MPRTRGGARAFSPWALAACLLWQATASLCRRRLNTSSCVGTPVIFEPSALLRDHPTFVFGSALEPYAAPAFGDIDGDGIVDALMGKKDGGLLFLKGQSGPSPRFQHMQGAGSDPFHGVDIGGYSSPALADVDGDGLVDALIGNSDGQLFLFKGQPDRTFRRLQGPGIDPFHGVDVGNLASPALADVDGDGLVDALVGYLHYGDSLWTSWGGLLLFLGHANGTFQRVQGAGVDPFHGFNVQNTPRPALADVDSDGILDMVVGHTNGQLQLFKGQVDGSFTSLMGAGVDPFYGVDFGGYANPALADLDGDGLLDVFVGNLDGWIHIRWGRADPAFRSLEVNPFRDLSVGNSLKPALADVDGDGLLDALVGDDGGRLHLLRGRADGSFVRLRGAGVDPFHGVDVGLWAQPALADVNRDGLVDAVVGSTDSTGSAYAARLSVFLGRPDGSFRRLQGLQGAVLDPFRGVAIQGGYARPAVADVDGDGLVDALVGNRAGQLLFFQGQSDGTFRRRQGAGVDPFHGVVVDSASPAIGDVDGDGLVDVLVGGKGGNVVFFRGQPGGTFLRVLASDDPFDGLDVGSSAGPAIADVDGDGRADVLIGNKDGQLLLVSRFCYTACGGRERGVCSHATGRCLCLPGIAAQDDHCSGCLPGHFGSSCQPCPGLTGGYACSRQGRCDDAVRAKAAAAQRGRAAASAWGSGACECTAPFSGSNCSQGECPAGFRKGLDIATDSIRCERCSQCPGGQTPRAGAQGDSCSCASCPAGTSAAAGSPACTPCASGTRAPVGSAACAACPSGEVPDAAQAGCTSCPAGTSAAAGSPACTPCASGTRAPVGSATCAACPSGEVPDAAQAGCEACAFGRTAVPGAAECTPDPAVLLVGGGAGALAVFLALSRTVAWCRRRRALAQLSEAAREKDAKRLPAAIREGELRGVPKVDILQAQAVLRTQESKYSTFDALLEAVEAGDLKLVRGSWLAEAKNLSRLKRQQDVSEEAFWTAQELRSQVHVVSFVAVSYSWLHKVHPDPRSEHLKLLQHALRQRLRVRGEAHIQDIALFLDFLSLPQKKEKEGGDPHDPDSDGDDRTEKEKERFARGLKTINVTYAHQKVQVWLMKDTPDRPKINKYDARGWTTFEQTVSGLVKDATKLIQLETKDVEQGHSWDQIVQRSSERSSREPPVTPVKFDVRIDTKEFTNGNTDTAFVKSKYKETFEDVIGNAEVLWFVGLGWKDKQARELAEVLKSGLCKSLKHLLVSGNPIGEEGARDLASAAAGCETLQTLDLAGTGVPDGGQPAIVQAWEEAGKRRGGCILPRGQPRVAEEPPAAPAAGEPSVTKVPAATKAPQTAKAPGRRAYNTKVTPV